MTVLSKSIMAGVAVIAFGAAALPVHADTITEDFALKVSSPLSYDNAVTIAVALETTPFKQFDPGIGTLTGVAVTLSGTADWTANSALDPILDLTLILFNPDLQFLREQTFSTPGAITLDESMTNTDLVDDSYLLGVLDTDFSLVLGFRGESGDIFTFETEGTQGLQGTITYDYTPNPALAVPEPASLALMGTGLLWLGLLWRSRKQI